jgi:hypothetical protein
VVNVEARVTLFAHVDAAVFADAGNVAARVSELNLDKRSYGIGWRMHSRTSTFARVDLARWRRGLARAVSSERSLAPVENDATPGAGAIRAVSVENGGRDAQDLLTR